MYFLKIRAHVLILAAACAIPVFFGGCDNKAVYPGPGCAEIEGACLYARAAGGYFEIYDGESWQQVIVKGVNIGTSLPGRWYTEFPADRALYAGWLEKIGAMNANAIRIYTLLDPAFYNVLAEYNSNPENETLWLFQEIWPHDEVPGLNLHDQAYRDEYREEIGLVIDALHGNADIPARPYRAYGNYAADVSPYLLGLMIGRELEPDEVEATNRANPEAGSFQGRYVRSAPGGSPTEAWLAEMCDYAAAYNHNKYNFQHPVGFVSWPTLDPLIHRSEWDVDGKPGYNDREVVDPANFIIGPDNRAGIFGAYHIYPNYPDFMNNEPLYALYSDEEGVFRYKGYLNNFMAIHPNYPALVAEFGISTSLNTAHENPEGLHHGGLSEEDQGEMVVRMMRSIVGEGYAGGLIFEWSDEWAKKTWNTEPFMVPWERQVLWQNAMCPEQNYGLLAVEPQTRSSGELFREWARSAETSSYNPVDGADAAFGRIDLIETGVDEAFFYLALTLSDRTIGPTGEIPWDKIGLAVGIDTGMPGEGEELLPLAGLPRLTGRVQFMLDFASADRASLRAVPSYNRGLLEFNPRSGMTGLFEPIKTMVSRERQTADGLFFPAIYSDESRLNRGIFYSEAPDYNSLAHWYEDNRGRIVVRLPWMLLNVSDPSSRTIIRDGTTFTDLPARDQLQTETGKGFMFYAATYSRHDKTGLSGSTDYSLEVIDFFPRRGDSFDQSVESYLWDGWEEPQYHFRLKRSYEIIARYFATIGENR